MLSFEEIYKIVENELSEERFFHSKCVMERCIEYAKIYGEDEEKCKIAGISHDIAREVPSDLILKKCLEYEVVLDDVEKEQLFIVHSKLGAEIAKKDFGCSEYICDSIKYHTTGRSNMTLIDKIVYLADKTGKDRKYDNVNYIYEAALKDLDKALILSLKNNIQYVLSKNILIHPDTLNAYNFLVKK